MWLFIPLIAYAAVILLSDAFHRPNLSPGMRVNTVVSLVGSIEESYKLLANKDATRFLLVGEIPTSTVRSGPPCFIFDSRGMLVCWTFDSGNDKKWNEVLQSARISAKKISLNDILGQVPKSDP